MEEKYSKDDIIEMHAIIQGRVQGVFFRATTRNYAKRLGITGTVRNLRDGNVEIFAQGTRSQLDQLMELLVEDPGPSHIDQINKTFVLPTRTFFGFEIAH